jgi:hypothetical protein
MIGLRFSNAWSHRITRFPGFDSDPHSESGTLGLYRSRDAANDRKALEYQVKGFDVFIIANADTVMRRPNMELLEACFPGVQIKKKFEPYETLLSIDKARRLLGYEPQHSWRDQI